MLFSRQVDIHYEFGGVYLPEAKTLENGKTEIKLVDQSKSDLPDVESTRLSRLLEAGVDLKQVPSKVLPSPDQVTLSVKPEEKQGE